MPPQKLCCIGHLEGSTRSVLERQPQKAVLYADLKAEFESRCEAIEHSSVQLPVKLIHFTLQLISTNRLEKEAEKDVVTSSSAFSYGCA